VRMVSSIEWVEAPRTGAPGTSLIIYRDRDTTDAGAVSSTYDVHTYREETR